MSGTWAATGLVVLLLGAAAPGARGPQEQAAIRGLLAQAENAALFMVGQGNLLPYAVDGLCQSAEFHARLGDKPKANALIAQAKDVVGQIDNEQAKNVSMQWVAIAQAEIGDLAEADLTLKKLDATAEKYGAMSHIVLMLARRGDLKEANARLLALALEKAPDVVRGGRVPSIAAQVKAARTHAAVGAILAQKGERAASAAHFRAAMERARSVKTGYLARDAYDGIITYAVEAGDFVMATAAAKSMSPSNASQAALVRVAVAQVHAAVAGQNLPQARALAARAEGIAKGVNPVFEPKAAVRPVPFGAVSDGRDELYVVDVGELMGQLALAQAAAGDADGARATIGSAKEFVLQPRYGQYQPLLHRTLIRARAAVGDLEAAKRDALGRVGVAFTDALAEVAILEAEAGRFDDAWATIGQMTLANYIGQPAMQVGRLEAKAVTLPELAKRIASLKDALQSMAACLGAAETLLER